MSIKNKKAQGGVFGMSFSMIFSIILIVFFIIVAFIAINFFMKTQRCSQIKLTLDEFNNDINQAFNSESSVVPENYSVPATIEYFCFVNLSANVFNANNIDQEIWDYIHNSETVNDLKNNLYIYSPDKTQCLKWAKIKRLSFSEKNPNCIKVVNGKLSLTLERKYTESLIFVRS